MSNRRVVIEFASDKALEEFVSDARAHHARDLADGHRDHGVLMLSSQDFVLVDDLVKLTVNLTRRSANRLEDTAECPP